MESNPWIYICLHDLPHLTLVSRQVTVAQLCVVFPSLCRSPPCVREGPLPSTTFLQARSSCSTARDEWKRNEWELFDLVSHAGEFAQVTAGPIDGRTCVRRTHTVAINALLRCAVEAGIVSSPRLRFAAAYLTQDETWTPVNPSRPVDHTASVCDRLCHGYFTPLLSATAKEMVTMMGEKDGSRS